MADDPSGARPPGLIRPGRGGRLAYLALVLALVVLFTRAWRIDQPYSIDFQAYWLAGARVAAGDAASLYAPGGGPAAGTPVALAAHEFKNLPVVALAFAPLSRLPYLEAKRVFWWLGLAALAASAALLGWAVLPASFASGPERVALLLALVFLAAPAHIALRHGQTTPLVLLLVVGWLAAGESGRPLLAGALLALATLVKLPLVALVLVELLRRRLRVTAAWAATTAVVVVFSLAVFGVELHRQYLAGIAEHRGQVMTGHNNQSVAAVVVRTLGPAAVRDWEPRPLPRVARVATAAIVLALGLAVLIAIAGAPENRHLELPAALAFGLVALPVCWDHYFLLLLPGFVTPAVGFGRTGLLTRSVAPALLALAYVLVALPTPDIVLDHPEAFGPAAPLLLSHYFLGGMLLLGLAVAGLRRAG